MHVSTCCQFASAVVFTLIVIARCETLSSTEVYPVATTERQIQDGSNRMGRGMNNMDMDMMDYDHDDHDDHDDHHDDMEEQKAVKQDPWAGYYDFLINEGSFKFWAVFQLVTAVLLIYSAFAAVYYAKFNVITADYDYYDDFFGRSNSGPATVNTPWLGLSSQTFQRIFNALSSKKYS